MKKNKKKMKVENYTADYIGINNEKNLKKVLFSLGYSEKNTNPSWPEIIPFVKDNYLLEFIPKNVRICNISAKIIFNYPNKKEKEKEARQELKSLVEALKKEEVLVEKVQDSFCNPINL